VKSYVIHWTVRKVYWRYTAVMRRWGSAVDLLGVMMSVEHEFMSVLVLSFLWVSLAVLLLHCIIDIFIVFIIYGFYRATLIVNAVFAVRLSVCPSCWCIVYRRLKISSIFFLGPVEPLFLFHTPSTGTKFQGNPFSRGAQYRRVGELATFDWNRRLSRKRYEKS